MQELQYVQVLWLTHIKNKLLWRYDNENENLLHAAAFPIIFDHACFVLVFFAGEKIMSPLAESRVKRCAFVWQAVAGNQQLYPTQYFSQREMFSAALGD